MKLLTTMVLVTATTAWAQDSVPASPVIPAVSADAQKTEANTAEDTTTSTAARIATATKAYGRKYTEYMKQVRAAENREKMTELYLKRPMPTKEVDMILKLAKENPKAEGIEKGLVWSLRTTDRAQRGAVTELLLTHYKDSMSIGKLAQAMRFDTATLQRIIKEAGSEKVRQGATYYLATRLMRDAKTKGQGLAMFKKLRDWPDIAEKNAGILAQVNGDLFALENLAVGCEAPDIVGNDQDDKEFKLSDYRGKVVLVDFWGIW